MTTAAPSACPGASRGQRREALYALCLSLLATAILGLAYDGLHTPLVTDNKLYYYMSERVASGYSPYSAIVDPKHMLPALLTGAAMALGRLCSVPDIAVARALSWLVLALSGWLAYLVTRELTGSRGAGLVAFLCMFASAGYVYMSIMGCRPKVFMVLFILLSAWFATRERVIWAGFCASLAFLCWQPALLILGTILAASAMRSNRWHLIGLCMTGAAVPQILYEAYFWAIDGLANQLMQSYVYPLILADARSKSLSQSALALVSCWKRGFGFENLVPLLCAGGSVAILAHRILRQRPILTRRPSMGWTTVALGAAAATAFTVRDNQGYPDLIFIVPFLAILLGAAVHAIGPLIGRGKPLLQGAIGVYLIVLMALGALRFRAHGFTLQDQIDLSDRVACLAEPGESVFVIDDVQLLAFSHLPNWTIWAVFFRGVEENYAFRNGGDRFSPEIDGEWPSYIFWGRTRPTGHELWLGDRYARIAAPDFARQGIRVYRLVRRD